MGGREKNILYGETLFSGLKASKIFLMKLLSQHLIIQEWEISS